MNIEVNNFNVFFIVFVTFLTSFLLMPIIKKIAVHVNAIDVPNDRKVHKKPMPRLGGLGMYASFLVGYMLFAEASFEMLSILIGGFVIILVGIIDDIKPVKARYKLIAQLVAAIIVVFYGNIALTHITLLGLYISFPDPISYIITIFFIIAITNAINLIDGLDGLAAGVSAIYFLTISVIAFILSLTNGLDVILALIMLGATLGFLAYNFHPASIFMGDSGSLFSGFTIAVIALLGFKTATVTSLVVPILILAIPIFDTLFAIFRRVIKHQSIGKPDKEHLHHQLLKMKFSTKVTVLIIYGINILFALVSIFFVLGDKDIAILIYVILMIALLFIVLKTDILYEHSNE